jgi:MFS transporter, MHS family, citrate/tricarballylate:H+ symporter
LLLQSERRAKRNAVIRALAGNVLEVYDYSVYGFYAVYIAAAFFPTGSAFLSLMLSLMTFGIAAVARPFGAIVLGSYTDRKGRRAGLLLTLVLMSVGSITIAITPGYATIGILAPLLIVIGRLIQGFAFGAESSGVNVYLAEIATPGNRGFYIAWQNASQGVTLSLTAGIGVILAATFSNEQMAAWGWRIPFVIGCLVIPVLFWLRRSLEETEVFLKSHHPRRTGEVLKILVEHSTVLVLALALWVLHTTGFYLMLTYTPTFGGQVLHLPPLDNLLVPSCAGLSFFVVTLLCGGLSDRFGCRPLVIAGSLLLLTTAFPAFSWLAAAPSFARLLAVDLWLSLLLGIYCGGVVPLIAELMPSAARTTGMALVISIGSGLFGSFTPALGILLTEVTGSPAAPALWLTVTALVALGAAVAVKRFVLTKGLEQFAT